MSNIETFSTPSSLHKIVMENAGFTIQPTADDSISLERFQPIARAAVAYSGSDYVTQEHYDGNFLDSVYFMPTRSS